MFDIDKMHSIDRMFDWDRDGYLDAFERDEQYQFIDKRKEADLFDDEEDIFDESGADYDESGLMDTDDFDF